MIQTKTRSQSGTGEAMSTKNRQATAIEKNIYIENFSWWVLSKVWQISQKKIYIYILKFSSKFLSLKDVFI